MTPPPPRLTPALNFLLNRTSRNQRRGHAPRLPEDPEDFLPQRPHFELSQYVSHVLDLSSQYGVNNSISNLTGPPNIFPVTVDFIHVAVPRTHGPWWDHLSRWTPARCPKNPEWFKSQDFIELLFDVPVFPTKVSVLETYHPGYVVRILAMSWDEGEDSAVCRWRTLWSGPADPNLPPNDQITFSPPIHPPGFATNVLRLEFSCSLSTFCLELAAVDLYGMPVDIMVNKEEEKLSPFTNNGYFDLLPFEIIEIILSHLTLPELCRLAQCSRTLRDCCYNPSMYRHLDLKPFWPSLCEEDLLSLKPRLTCARSLGLSWTGNDGRFSPTWSEHLLHLELANCHWITNKSLESVIKHCPNLRDLDLSSCDGIPPGQFRELSSLQRLQRLVLYRTRINVSSLRSLCSFYSLTDLDLGWCRNVCANSGVLVEMARELPRLRRLLLTANQSVSDADLESLATHCPLLEKLDILGTVIEGIMGTDVDGSKRVTKVARRGRKIKIASRNENGTWWSVFLLQAEPFTFCRPLIGWIFIRT
uniref:F-box and leucine-rich repeat protein 4 n=1 Tax=Eptatretus burgeri TaxID=7764 RepID=A0A8C4QI18_EPTBU